MWLSVSKTGGVVLCDNRSRFEVAAAFTTSEWKLATMHAQPGDVVVADSAYGTYVDLALVHSANADAVFGNIMRVTVIFVGARSWALAIILSNGSVLGDVLNQCPEDFEHYQQASKWEVHLLIQRPGFHRNHFGHHFS